MKRKTNLATFGVFQISEGGADSLLRSRDEGGNPIKTYAKGVEVKQSELAKNGTLNLVVRSIKPVK